MSVIDFGSVVTGTLAGMSDFRELENNVCSDFFLSVISNGAASHVRTAVEAIIMWVYGKILNTEEKRYKLVKQKHRLCM